jgi:hypothetical protein
MPNSKKINFREERDFSQMLNVTFGFIRQNFKKLFYCILYFVVPFALLAGIFNGIYRSRLNQAASGELYYRPWGEYGFFQNVTSLNYLISLFFIYLSFIFISLTVYAYMVLYQDNQGRVEIKDVWEMIRSNFLQTFYASFGILLMCLLGYVVLLIPGIYLTVALSFYLIIMIREEVGFIEAIERSLYLIKDNWWSTLGLFLMVGLIQLMISLVGYLPALVLKILKVFKLPLADNSFLVILVNTFTTVAGVIFYVITITAIAFQYFNLVEIKDGIGLMQQADLIGRPKERTAPDDTEY